MWPDIRLANNRIAKLNTLAKYDKISIKSKKGVIPRGVPDGKKIVINWKKCSKTPIIFNAIKKIKNNKMLLLMN